MLTDPTSKIEYTCTVQKEQSRPCTIQNRPIPLNSSFHFHHSWENILIMQIKDEYSLKYFFCSLETDPSCSYSHEIPNMQPIDVAAYSLIQKTTTYSLSY